MNCSKCGSEMQDGLFIDQGYLGTPVWDTLKWGQNNGTCLGMPKVKNEISIQAYRCTSCGFIELFAPKSS